MEGERVVGTISKASAGYRVLTWGVTYYDLVVTDRRVIAAKSNFSGSRLLATYLFGHWGDLIARSGNRSKHGETDLEKILGSARENFAMSKEEIASIEFKKGVRGPSFDAIVFQLRSGAKKRYPVTRQRFEDAKAILERARYGVASGN